MKPTDEPLHQFPITAATPSMGVRVWIEKQKVWLHMGNEGGRGTPLRIVLVPVHGTTQLQLAVPGGLKAVYENFDTRQAFRKTHCRTPRVALPYPSTHAFSPEEWRDISRGGTAHVLVLMLFREFDVRKRNPQDVQEFDEVLDREIAKKCEKAEKAAADDAFSQAFSTDAFSDYELEALMRFFESPMRPSWIRRGLVCLADEDVPHGKHSHTEPVTFALGSCQYPAGIVDGTPQDHPTAPIGPADASMLRLAARMQPGKNDRPSLLLLVGDQIYVDATAGLFDPRIRTTHNRRGKKRFTPPDEDWVRVPYQNWLGSVGSQSVFGLVPTRMMLDDHELHDNWEPLPKWPELKLDQDNEALRYDGLTAYSRYQRNCRAGGGLAHQWQIYEHRKTRFFIADTRTERAARKAADDPQRAMIMSPEQACALIGWLRLKRDRPAFIASPAILLPRRRTSVRDAHGALQSDAWCGFPGSLHALLASLWRTGRSNVVFLSGDEHLCCIVTATVTDQAGTRTVTFHSIHSSGLYTPFPFANSVPEDFMRKDEWCFADPRHPNQWFRCEVTFLKWYPGDGFAVLTLQDNPAGHPAKHDWTLSVSFDRESGPTCPVSLQL